MTNIRMRVPRGSRIRVSENGVSIYSPSLLGRAVRFPFRVLGVTAAVFAAAGAGAALDRAVAKSRKRRSRNHKRMVRELVYLRALYKGDEKTWDEKVMREWRAHLNYVAVPYGEEVCRLAVSAACGLVLQQTPPPGDPDPIAFYIWNRRVGYRLPQCEGTPSKLIWQSRWRRAKLWWQLKLWRKNHYASSIEEAQHDQQS
jgi:hypothetical protein